MEIKMKTLIALVIASLACSMAAGKTTSTRGYVKKNGTYVAPHVKTTPDKTKNNNYSTRGNANPRTGKEGTKPRDGEVLPRTP